jgi:hypothetical protein
MDPRYAHQLTAFISQRPNEAPIDPAAPDPLRTRPPELSPTRRPMRTAAPPDGLALLPLILAQLPLQPTYRLRRVPRGPQMNGR